MWQDPNDKIKASEFKPPKTNPQPTVQFNYITSSIADCVTLDRPCVCGSLTFDVLERVAGRYRDSMRVQCCFCGARETMPWLSSLSVNEYGEMVLPAGEYKGKTLEEVWASGEVGQSYVRLVARTAKDPEWRRRADVVASASRVQGVSERLHGGGGDAEGSGGSVERVDNRDPSTGGLLGLAAEAASSGRWTWLARVGADPRGD
jgi:hypothetical protein